MPIYEYECRSCGHHLEAFQKMSDTPLTECPTCHKTTLQKLISAAGFQLKGTGWYATDFRTKDRSDKTKTPDSPDSTSKTETTATETPPPKTTDTKGTTE